MKRWARDWDCCQECGTTESPHCARGLCKQCYGHWHYLAHGEEYHARYLARTPNRQRRAVRLIHCPECGRNLKHYCKGFCKTCYKRMAGKEYYAENRDAVLARTGQYQRERREQYNEYGRQWVLADPERARRKQRKSARTRRARMAQVVVSDINEVAVYALNGYMCIYCGATQDLTLDHIVPIANGGPHCEENLVVACKRCNCSKGDRPLGDWLQTQPRALAWVT